MERKGIGISNLPNLKHNHFISRGCTFNIMVVGSHGLGKTTFLNQFLGTKVLNFQPFEEKNGNPFWHLEGLCNIQTSCVEIYEGAMTTKLNITEVDAVGDNVDNTSCYEPIVALLEENFENYSAEFHKATKDLIEDKRVHLCLYFLEPLTFIKMADLEVMRKISKYCTIIPIIAKADLIKTSQLQDIKNAYREILSQNGISFFEDVDNAAMAPFFIFSQFRDEASGYSWCNTPTSSQDANEFHTLKRLILEKSIVVFKCETDHYYDSYRVFSMLSQSNDDGSGKSMIEKKIEEYQQKIGEVKERIRQKRLEAPQNVPERNVAVEQNLLGWHH